MTSLVADLGGTAGFGEFSLSRNDDSSTGLIDLTPIFGAQGINFFGRYYTGFYLNNNGSVTFNAASSSFTPTAITGSTSNPVIAAYWADIDTRGGTVTPTPGRHIHRHEPALVRPRFRHPDLHRHVGRCRLLQQPDQQAERLPDQHPQDQRAGRFRHHLPLREHRLDDRRCVRRQQRPRRHARQGRLQRRQRRRVFRASAIG